MQTKYYNKKTLEEIPITETAHFRTGELITASPDKDGYYYCEYCKAVHNTKDTDLHACDIPF